MGAKGGWERKRGGGEEKEEKGKGQPGKGRNQERRKERKRYHYCLMGTPSRAGGGLTLDSCASLSFAAAESVAPSESSALVSCCKKLPSLAGLLPWNPIEPGWPLMLLPGTCWPWELALPPLLAAAGLLAPGEVAVRCGMFSGTGCWEPMLVTPTSEAFPALLSA